MTLKEFITVLILAILTGLDQWELRRRLRKGNVDAQTIHARSMVNLTAMLMQSTILIIIISQGLSLLSAILTAATFITAIWTLYNDNKSGQRQQAWKIIRIIIATMLANIGGWYMAGLLRISLPCLL